MSTIPGRLRFVTYSGMTIPMAEGNFRDTLRARAARRIREARAAGQQVRVVERGQEWEFEAPEAALVGDGDGFLVLVEPEQDDSCHCGHPECGAC